LRVLTAALDRRSRSRSGDPRLVSTFTPTCCTDEQVLAADEAGEVAGDLVGCVGDIVDGVHASKNTP
jgi:hypothetical protein